MNFRLLIVLARAPAAGSREFAFLRNEDRNHATHAASFVLTFVHDITEQSSAKIRVLFPFL